MKKEELKLSPLSECDYCKHKIEAYKYSSHIRCSKPDPNMKGNTYGIWKGWFNYPEMFNPVWKLEKCKNFEAKE